MAQANSTKWLPMFPRVARTSKRRRWELSKILWDSWVGEGWEVIQRELKASF